MVTVGGAMQHLLADTRIGRTAYVIGTPSMRSTWPTPACKVLNGTDLASRAEVVVVAGTDDLLRRPAQRGARRPARGRPAGHAPRPDLSAAGRPWPGTGAILAAVEYATGRTAEIVGKPEPQLFLTALDRLGEGRTLVIGDRADSDLAGRGARGLDAALVLTGGGDRAAGSGRRRTPWPWRETLAALILRLGRRRSSPPRRTPRGRRRRA